MRRIDKMRGDRVGGDRGTGLLTGDRGTGLLTY